MTLRSFTPTAEYRAYRVVLDVDRFDPDQGRTTVQVNAIGPTNARELALEQLKDRYPAAVALRAEEVGS